MKGSFGLIKYFQWGVLILKVNVGLKNHIF